MTKAMLLMYLFLFQKLLHTYKHGQTGNLAQVETLVLNVSGRILMVNKENSGNATENLVSICITV